jgi:uncharacterized repeat protein (TIGR02543 family)
MLIVRAETSFEDVMYAESEAELIAVVDNAESGVYTVISFEGDIGLSGTLVIAAEKNITLISNSKTEFFKLIGADGATTITVETNGVLELAGINVTHAESAAGRGVVVQSGGTLTLSDGAISGNNNGGGVHNSGTFSMFGGVISDNTAANNLGGGIHNSDGSLNIFGGIISGNSADNGGGIYNTGTSFVVSNCIITYNSVISSVDGGFGGGIYNTGDNFAVSNCTIANNIIIGYGVSGFGGGIYNTGDNFAVSNCTIANNTANIANNTANYIANNGGVGGGIYNAGDGFVVSFCLITNNKATQDGGGIYNTGTSFVVSNCTLTNNNVIGGRGFGGGICSQFDSQFSYNFVISNCTIANNTADSYGGGIFNSDRSNFVGGDIYNDDRSSFVVSNCIIANNTASAGGGIHNNGGVGFVVSNCTIANNTAPTGGGITANGGRNFVVSNCIIVNNTAQDGGGIHNSYGGSFLVSNCTIINNTATSNGGGIYNGRGLGLAILNSTIANNTANGFNYYPRKGFGGGIYNEGVDFSVSNCIIANNTATSPGGGIYNNEIGFLVSNSTVANNTASAGGGIYNEGVDFSVSNCILTNNTALGGGGIYNSGDRSFSVSNSTIINNTATYSGGGITNNGGDNSVMSNCNIVNNTAQTGGGIYNDQGNFMILNGDGSIFGNCAVNGGGIYIAGGIVKLYDGTIADNTASNDGGGIWVALADLNQLFVYNGVVFANNSASATYDRDPLHDAIYHAQIDPNVIWTTPFTQGYNNYDISYTSGAPAVFYTVAVTDSFATVSGAGNYVTGALVVLDAGSRADYRFLGWTVNEGGVMLSSEPQATFIMPTNNVVVTTNWAQAVVQYVIIYELDGGANSEGNPGVYMVVDLPLSIADPTKPDFTFLGWVIEYADGTTISAAGSLTIAENTTGDVTLSARWQPIDTSILNAYDVAFVEFCSYYDVETWQFCRDLFAGFSVESVLEAETIMGTAGQVHADLLAVYGRLEAGRFGPDDSLEVIAQATHILTQAIVDMNAALRPVEGPVLFVDICDLGGVFRVWFSHPLEIENIAAVIDGQTAEFDGIILSSAKTWLAGVGYLNTYSYIEAAKVDNWQTIALTLTSNGQTLIVELVNDRYEPPTEQVTIIRVTPTAFVTQLNGNKNNLTITITEELSNATTNTLTETFSINNNGADTYTVGSYRVYVDTKGNTQIRVCYLIE